MSVRSTALKPCIRRTREGHVLAPVLDYKTRNLQFSIHRVYWALIIQGFGFEMFHYFSNTVYLIRCVTHRDLHAFINSGLPRKFTTVLHWHDRETVHIPSESLMKRFKSWVPQRYRRYEVQYKV